MHPAAPGDSKNAGIFAGDISMRAVDPEGGQNVQWVPKTHPGEQEMEKVPYDGENVSEPDSLEQARSVLSRMFGYASFKPGQADVIASLLEGRDCLAVMPTGAGKSVCYQVPAMLTQGTTLVVSPLISLMRDQVTALLENGVQAAFINSSLTYNQTQTALERAAAGAYKLMYVAPERLDSPDFARWAQSARIPMVAVDEAHCVSHWGQDFRPSYLNIGEFVRSLPERPVLSAFTATATREVKDDIVRLLELRDPFEMTTGFNRENLYLEVQQPANRFQALIACLMRRRDRSGIVYCLTRKDVETVCRRLCESGIPAVQYHAGLGQGERTAAQEDFLHDRRTVMVATNAFGMGIDKSNVGFVIHYGMPKNIESYYQEAGRAGRDGAKADCILLYSKQDVMTNRRFIENAQTENLTAEEAALVRSRDEERLRQMTFYSTTQRCLRRFILEYFGDRTPTLCGNCSNCRELTQGEDVTVDAQKVLSCISRMGSRYGAALVTGVLRGESGERIVSLGFDKLSTYGIMKDVPAPEVRELIDFLVANGYCLATQDEYRVLKLNDRSMLVLRGREKVTMPRRKQKESRPAAAPKKDGRQTGSRKAAKQVPGLLGRLKALRLEIAGELRVPPFMIFSDATLGDMCAKMPQNEEELLLVSGVGEHKLERYGKRFLAVLREAQTLQR